MGKNRPPSPDTMTPYARRLMLERYDSKPETIDELMRLLSVPRSRIHGWARRLNLNQQRVRTWTPEEDAYLEEHGSDVSHRQIAIRLQRSREAIVARLAVLGASKQFKDYTVASLASALGCSETLVQSWIRDGKLKARKRNSERTEAQGGDFWLITDDYIVEFLLKHGEQVQVHWDRVRWCWLLSVLRTGRRTLRTLKLDTDEDQAG